MKRWFIHKQPEESIFSGVSFPPVFLSHTRAVSMNTAALAGQKNWGASLLNSRFFRLFVYIYIFLCLPLFLQAQQTFIRTAEDHSRWEFFQDLFKKRVQVLQKPDAAQNIPYLVHFVWLGSRAFPEHSIKNLQKWIALHPGWKFYLWTDVARDEALPAEIIQRPISSLALDHLSAVCDLCDNLGEKAKLLVYEILFEEGGIYADHDVSPEKSFAPLCKRVDFFCGLQELGPSFCSSSVFVSTHLIGSAPSHPLLLQAMQWLSNNWDSLEKSYPGKDRLCKSSRAQHRTYWAINAALENCHAEAFERVVVFPPQVLSSKEKNVDSLATHQAEKTWLQEDADSEIKLTKQLQGIIRESSSKNKWMLAIALLNIAVLGLFFKRYK